MILSSLYFDSGSSTLTESAKNKLNEIGYMLKSINDIKIYIVGNSDEKGLVGDVKEKYGNNYALSVSRANAVGDFISKRYGINHYKVFGLSNNYRYSDALKSKELSRDRRVDIYISSSSEILNYFNTNNHNN